MMQATFAAVTVAVFAFAGAVSAQESSTSEVFDKVESGVAWTQSPTAFRGISFGGTEADLVAALGPVKCHDTGGAASVRECRANKNESRMTVNGVLIEDFYQFRHGKLVEVRLEAQTSAFAASPPPAPSYASVLTAFSEKYGSPTETHKTRLRGVRSVHYTLAGQPIGPYVPYEYISSSAMWRTLIPAISAA